MMQEEYLHFIWRLKRLPFHQLTLTNGQSFELIHTGFHNTDAGPDFFNSRVRMEGILWVGHTEIHVKSSDWHKHGHEKDPAYDNTILHVVFEHDQEIEIHGRVIPTLELKSFVDWDHYNRFTHLKSKNEQVACATQIDRCPEHLRYSQIEAALFQRLNRKSALFSEQHIHLKGNLTQVLYEAYGRSFGLKVNELAFQELCQRVPLPLVWRLSSTEVKTLFLGASGMFKRFPDEIEAYRESEWTYLKHKYQLSEMELVSWKFKGLRPASNPIKRIMQFADFCQHQDFFSPLQFAENKLIKNLFRFTDSPILRHLIVVNVVVPFLWWQGEDKNLPELQEYALETLQSLKPETNQVIAHWRQIGLKVKSSFDSQGLLELKNEFCTHKKCLSCKIGYHLISA